MGWQCLGVSLQTGTCSVGLTLNNRSLGLSERCSWHLLVWNILCSPRPCEQQLLNPAHTVFTKIPERPDLDEELVAAHQVWLLQNSGIWEWQGEALGALPATAFRWYIIFHWTTLGSCCKTSSSGVSNSRIQVREVRMLVYHEGLFNCWHGVSFNPAAAVMLAGPELAVLNGKESGKAGVAWAGAERQEAE